MVNLANSVTVGVVDIGSNTVHLIVARTNGTEIEVLEDQKEMARLGEDVSYHGEILPAKLEQLLGLLDSYRKLANARKAHYLVFGTEPLRAARNSIKLVQRARQELGLTIHVLSQPEEAILSFRGATHNMLLPNHFVMADIGGGSTEIVLVNFHQIHAVVKLPVGSIKLRALCRAGDPITRDQIHLAQFKLGEIFGATTWPETSLTPIYGIVAGGNAKAVTRLFNKGRRGETLRKADVMQAVRIASSKPSSALASEYNLVPSRALTFGTGAMIINAIMEKFQIDNVTVSKFGIREGVIISYAYFGEGWRDTLGV